MTTTTTNRLAEIETSINDMRSTLATHVLSGILEYVLRGEISKLERERDAIVNPKPADDGIDAFIVSWS